VLRKRLSQSSRPAAPEPLVCPSCGAAGSREERFCPRCGMPLVYSAGAAPEPRGGEASERARKVRPEYARGNLVRVAGGRNQAEAEMIQNLLLEEGVPSLVRRSAGFDVPDFLAAGPRDVLVPESGAEAARELLRAGELAPASAAPWRPDAVRLLVAIVGGGAVAALIAWALAQLA
jgi:Putative prokaryotic signal transducing protein